MPPAFTSRVAPSSTSRFVLYYSLSATVKSAVLRLRVGYTIESESCDPLLPHRSCNPGVCSQLYIHILLRDIKCFIWLRATTTSVSSLVEGHYGSEAISSLIERFSALIVTSTLKITKHCSHESCSLLHCNSGSSAHLLAAPLD